MGWFPWEKLSPLVCGPLLLILGGLLLFTDASTPAKAREYLLWGTLACVAGLVVTAYGVLKRQRRGGHRGER